jgi:hypothetical protein
LKLCFTIDALSPAGDKAWRLLENNSWRECTYAEPLQDGDAHLTDKATAEFWAGRRLKRNKETTLKPQEKAGRFDLLIRGIIARAALHRTTSAPIPAKEQMLSCYEQLEPGTPWLVYLNISGHFQALDTSRTSIISNMDIAVRGEIASSENFVGPIAAANEQMMDNLYISPVSGWLARSSEIIQYECLRARFKKIKTRSRLHRSHQQLATRTANKLIKA